jgi:hypothetical protein
VITAGPDAHTSPGPAPFHVEYTAKDSYPLNEVFPTDSSCSTYTFTLKNEAGAIVKTWENTIASYDINEPGTYTLELELRAGGGGAMVKKEIVVGEEEAWIVTMTDNYSWNFCPGYGNSGDGQLTDQWEFTGTEEELKEETGLCEGYTENPHNCYKTGFTCSRSVNTNSIVRIGHASCSCTAGTNISSSSFVYTYTWERKE